MVVNHRRFVLGLLGVLLFSGCQDRPIDPPIDTDKQPPVIVRRTQNDSQNGNRISDKIEIFFNESLKADSVNKQTVVVNGKNAELLDTDIYYDDVQKKIVITPKFDAPNASRVSVTNGVKDIAGNAFLTTNFTINYPEWTYLDTTSLQRPDSAVQSSLIFDSKNRPTLVYFTQFPREIIVKVYINSQWSTLGAPLLIDNEFKYQISNLKLISHDNTIYVGWQQANRLNGQSTFLLKKLLDNKWIEVTQIDFDNDGFELNFSVDSKGAVYIAFYNYERLIRVKRFSSGTWQSLGSSAINQDMPYLSPGTPPTFIVRNLTLALINDLPVVAWSNAYPELIQVKRWDASSWVSVGNTPSVGIGGSVFPSLASKDNRLIVAWIERDPITSQSDIYVKEWISSNWVSLGDRVNGTLSGGDPLIYFAPNDNQPQIIYWEAGNGKSSVLIKRYTTQWTKLFLGSPYNDFALNNLIRNQPFFDNEGRRFVLGMDSSRIYVATPNTRN